MVGLVGHDGARKIAAVLAAAAVLIGAAVTALDWLGAAAAGIYRHHGGPS